MEGSEEGDGPPQPLPRPLPLLLLLLLRLASPLLLLHACRLLPGQAAARGRLHRGGRDGADGPLGRRAGPAGHDRDPPRRHQGQGAGGRPKGPALLARGGGARGRRRRRAETRRRAAVAHGTHRAPRAQSVDDKKAHDRRAG